MSITFREATAADQQRIRQIVRGARLNPMSLDWPNFLVAEDGDHIVGKRDDGIVGVGQVKEHRDGSRELASIVVIQEYRGQGIARTMIERLLAREEGVIYLVCGHELEGFYRRFGFYRAQGKELSRSMARIERMGNFFARLMSTFSNRKFWIIAMKRLPGD